MKEAYLPLKEIRQIMLSLSDEEVKQRLMEKNKSIRLEEVDNGIPQFKKSKESDALNYISNLMETQTKFRTNQFHSRQPPQFDQVDDLQIPLPISPDDVENWQRIILAPGVEMHLRYPTDSDTHHRIQQLISFAKKIFLKQ